MPLRVDPFNCRVNLCRLKRLKPHFLSSFKRKMSATSVSATSPTEYWDLFIQRGEPVDLDAYLAYAESLAQSGQWKEALDALASAHHHYQVDVDSHPVGQFMIRFVRLLADGWTRSGASSFSDRLKVDNFSCCKCGGVLCDPMTLWCGHTYCRKCVGRDSITSCLKCSRRQFHAADDPANLKVNVVISALVEKCWSPQLQAIRLRTLGNQLFSQNRYQEALEQYNQAVPLAGDDFALFSNRSHLYHKLGRYEDALRDGEEVVHIRPEWPKGHFRRAVALISLGNNEDALLSLLQCVAYEKKLLQEVEDDIIKILFKIISSAAKSQSAADIVQPPGKRQCGVVSGSTSGGESGEDSLDDLGLVPSSSKLVAGSSSRQLISHSIKTHIKLHKLVDQISAELERIKKTAVAVSARPLNPAVVEAADLECTLCYRLFWQPVSTPCGHTFCRTCLDRCLDHNPACPLCKTSLENYLAERRQSPTEFLDSVMILCLPEEHAERARLHEEEMKEMASINKIPIFICTLAYPTVPCPLHVFEPRYRLMIRRSMESGTRQFGMCAYVEDQPQGFAEYGTMLEVRDVEYFADGRSVVDTVGGRRFRVMSRGMVDGYSTANVEFLVDKKIEDDRLPAVTALQERVRQEAQDWIRSARPALRDRIVSNFGSMPTLEADWMSLPNGPAWFWWLVAILPLAPKDQLVVLAMTDVERRLETIQRIVRFVRQRTC